MNRLNTYESEMAHEDADPAETIVYVYSIADGFITAGPTESPGERELIFTTEKIAPDIMGNIEVGQKVKVVHAKEAAYSDPPHYMAYEVDVIYK